MAGLQGWQLVIIIAIVLLLFAAPKLPAMARNLGQSMRIFKSEVKQMKDDGTGKKDTSDSADGQDPEGSDAVEGRIVNGDADGTRNGRKTGTNDQQ